MQVIPADSHHPSTLQSCECGPTLLKDRLTGKKTLPHQGGDGGWKERAMGCGPQENLGRCAKWQGAVGELVTGEGAWCLSGCHEQASLQDDLEQQKCAPPLSWQPEIQTPAVSSALGRCSGRVCQASLLAPCSPLVCRSSVHGTLPACPFGLGLPLFSLHLTCLQLQRPQPQVKSHSGVQGEDLHMQNWGAVRPS